MRHRGRKTRRGSAAVRAPVCARRLVSYQYSSLLCRIAGVLSEAQLMHHIVAAVDQRGGNNNNNHREETGERGREGGRAERRSSAASASLSCSVSSSLHRSLLPSRLVRDASSSSSALLHRLLSLSLCVLLQVWTSSSFVAFFNLPAGPQSEALTCLRAQ